MVYLPNLCLNNLYTDTLLFLYIFCCYSTIYIDILTFNIHLILKHKLIIKYKNDYEMYYDAVAISIYSAVKHFDVLVVNN